MENNFEVKDASADVAAAVEPLHLAGGLPTFSLRFLAPLDHTKIHWDDVLVGRCSLHVGTKSFEVRPQAASFCRVVLPKLFF